MNTRGGDQVANAGGGQTGARLLRLLAALILVNVLLLAPQWVLAGGIGGPWIALEAGVIVGVFALLPRNRWSTSAALIMAMILMLVTIVALGDTATRLSLARPLNLYVDIWLLGSVRNLLTGALGPALAILLTLVTLVAASGAVLLTGYLLAPARAERGVLFTRVATLTIIVLVSLGLTGDRVPALAKRVDTPVVTLALEQTIRFVEMTKERDRFVEDLAEARDSYAEVPGLLSRLQGKDVVVAFIESYGTSALYDPRYGPVVGPRLDDLEARAKAAGLHLVTGRLVAPSQGGQSWFGHGSLLSGLWLDNQLRYDMMLAAQRKTLIDDFEHAGYRTVALMPAITMAWPEGERFGYDEVFAHRNIEYAGPPLNWVTMPDQFAWSFLENTIRRDRTQPLFAEIGLISSHAPWTPILPVLDDWDSIGDGAVFAPWGDTGERPEDLWLDTDRVREHYALSVEYAVHAMAAYAEHFVDEHTLLIVLGDHQPAPLITGDEAPWDVPVHVISGDSAVLEPFQEWGFVPGAWPDADLIPPGMDYFRDWFVRAYSTP
jgi:hypothetical protein